MDELLVEAFRHNAWATKRLLAACRDLTPAQLTAPGKATYGSILATLNHLVHADGGYLPATRVDRPQWATSDETDIETDDLAVLEARADEAAALWERYLADPLPARDLLLLDAGTYECWSSVVIVQALHHANVHREQVCSMLTGLGIEPPDLQPWAFADETARARFLGGRTE